MDDSAPRTARARGLWLLVARRSKRGSLALSFLICALSAPALPGCICHYPADPLPPVAAIPSYGRPSNVPGATPLAVVGDVQRTSSAEYCLLCRELNDTQQRLLMKDLNAQRFGGLVLLGDMAFDGDDRRWQHFDAMMAPLAEAHWDPIRSTVFFPVLGNHDYFPGSPQQILKRFPRLARSTHYAYDWGAVRLLVLDGNREQLCRPEHRAGRPSLTTRELCRVEWLAQLAWLRHELDDVDGSPTARGALVFVHQSPYTQSPWVEGDQADARAFAELLMASQRGLALISAHAHGFERYAYGRAPRSAKDFIVTAGGGGPRPPRRRYGAPKDNSDLPWPRPFNYLLLTQSAWGVDVSVHGIGKPDRAVRELSTEHRQLKFL